MSPYLASLSFKELEKIAYSIGYTLNRKKGSHFVYQKKGAKRPLVIPKHKRYALGTLRGILKSIGVSPQRAQEILESKGNST